MREISDFSIFPQSENEEPKILHMQYIEEKCHKCGFKNRFILKPEDVSYKVMSKKMIEEMSYMAKEIGNLRKENEKLRRKNENILS
jgi:phage FluMu protein Com